MQQLDLFGAVEETKPKSNVEKVADADLHIVHVKEIEKEPEEIKREEEPQPEKITEAKEIIEQVEIIPQEKIETKEIIEAKENEPGETETETKPKKEVVKQEPKENKRGRKSYKEMEAEAGNVELPDDETLFQKQYYTISEVAEWFKVNTSLIRYWENEFDILKPRKTRKGDRLFRPEDVKNLNLIYHLLRQRKLSIEGAKQYLKEHKTKADTQMVLIQSLTKFRSFLLEWKAILGA
jgi:DNA-binding transcriptional MerR regulator